MSAALAIDEVAGAKLPDCTYIGFRSGAAAVVSICPGKAALPVRRDLVDHSPDGFEWGYGGSGPAQLALALLAHATADSDRAVDLHQQFKSEVVAGWPRDRGWKITAHEVRQWADLIEHVHLSRMGGS
jgi:hypothetical protein